MTDDLTTRLREVQGHQRPFHVFHGEVPAETIYGEAADRIEALEKANVGLTRDFNIMLVENSKNETALTARDAVIAEALAVREMVWLTTDEAWSEIIERLAAPRVPQGAAEPKLVTIRDYPHSHFNMCNGAGGSCFTPWCTCPCHAWVRDASEATDADLGAFDGAEAQFGAAVRRVTPDRQPLEEHTLARALYVADNWGLPNAGEDWDSGKGPSFILERYLSLAHRLLASGVLGVPADSPACQSAAKDD